MKVLDPSEWIGRMTILTKEHCHISLCAHLTSNFVLQIMHTRLTS